MTARDRVAGGQSQAHALTYPLGREEGLKQVGKDRLAHAHAVVAHLDPDFAWLGIEHDQYQARSAGQLSSAMEDVNAKLKAAGFSESPELHFQFIGQY